jgi:hypothetical protein
MAACTRLPNMAAIHRLPHCKADGICATAQSHAPDIGHLSVDEARNGSARAPAEHGNNPRLCQSRQVASHPSVDEVG